MCLFVATLIVTLILAGTCCCRYYPLDFTRLPTLYIAFFITNTFFTTVAFIENCKVAAIKFMEENTARVLDLIYSIIILFRLSDIFPASKVNIAVKVFSIRNVCLFLSLASGN